MKVVDVVVEVENRQKGNVTLIVGDVEDDDGEDFSSFISVMDSMEGKTADEAV